MRIPTYIRRAFACAAILGLAACATPGDRATGNPSPIAGSANSQSARQRAEVTMNRNVTYANAAKPGPRLVVLPGDVRSSHVYWSGNNIADYAELELTRANFGVLERRNLGPQLAEAELAYNMGDPTQAAKVFRKGAYQTTRWMVKFDLLKAEPVATSGGGFDGGVASRVLGIFTSGKMSSAAQTVGSSVSTDQDAKVWVLGMRYRVIDAQSTVQVANGYVEETMEAGATRTAVGGVRSRETGQQSFDSMMQKMIQLCVAEIDAKNK